MGWPVQKKPPSQPRVLPTFTHPSNQPTSDNQFRYLEMNPREEGWREKQRPASADASHDRRRDDYPGPLSPSNSTAENRYSIGPIIC